MPWVQVHITLPFDRVPFAEALLETLGALSVTLQDGADQPVYEPAPGETPLWKQARVSGLFDENVNTHALSKALAEGLNNAPTEISVTPLDDAPWERAWLDHFEPMRFGRRLWICPKNSPMRESSEDAVVLRMDPGMAFGTGTHATTALCLEWLDAADVRGKRVIDYGCGSGILAIATLLLGAREVVAVDHDEQAIAATIQNARENGVEDRLSVVDTESTLAPADILLGNILAGTLIDLAPKLAATTATDGDVVLSGILREQSAAVETAYAVWFQFDHARYRDDWTLICGRKKPAQG